MDNRDIELKEKEIWSDFLFAANSEELFKSVITKNYDDIDLESQLTQKILNDNQVDMAVVLAFYWRLAPRFTKQFVSRKDVPSWLEDSYQIVTLIEEKFINNFYDHSEIYYDPKSDFGEDWTTAYMDKDPNRILPKKMEQELDGVIFIEEPYDTFDNGLPIELAEEIFNLFD